MQIDLEAARMRERYAIRPLKEAFIDRRKCTRGGATILDEKLMRLNGLTARNENVDVVYYAKARVSVDTKDERQTFERQRRHATVRQCCNELPRPVQHELVSIPRVSICTFQLTKLPEIPTERTQVSIDEGVETVAAFLGFLQCRIAPPLVPSCRSRLRRLECRLKQERFRLVRYEFPQELRRLIRSHVVN
jgi:hypothetical protein